MTQTLEVKYGLPREVNYCKACVISNQRPTTTLEVKHDKNQIKPTTAFDENGICDACRWAEIKNHEIDWHQREQELIELLDKYRSPTGDYDVVVPGSGGKDSAFVAHMLKTKYDMHPLTVTWAPHLYTEIGWQNLQRFIQSGFDNYLMTPNGEVHRLLTSLAFKNLGHPFQPFIFGQRNLAPSIAAKFDIKLVFYGENVAEYGNNIQDNYDPCMDEKLYTSVDVTDPDLFIGGVTIRELKEKYQLSHHDLLPYASPSLQVIREKKIDFRYMSYYHKWVPQENYYYAHKHTNFHPNTERTQGSYSKYSSIDDKIDPFHYFMSLIKFGMGRATSDAAQEIRSGKITREEGIALVKRYDAEFPDKYFPEFLDYIDIDEEQFWVHVNHFRSPHLWIETDGQWQLRHQVE